ncbi:MAG: GerMN domain-containing protein [Candidatus Ratteibacteria bacterium]|jgi:spore germination protein GerM
MGTRKRIKVQKIVLISLAVLWAILLLGLWLVRHGTVSGGPLTIYFMKSESRKPVLVEVRRRPGLSGRDLSRLERTFRELAQGPSPEEKESGLISCIPNDVKILRIFIQDDILYLDLNKTIESGGGVPEMEGRLAQLVYTAVAYPGVNKLRLLIEGKEIKSFGGEGLTEVDHPMTKSDFSEYEIEEALQ